MARIVHLHNQLVIGEVEVRKGPLGEEWVLRAVSDTERRHGMLQLGFALRLVPVQFVPELKHDVRHQFTGCSPFSTTDTPRAPTTCPEGNGIIWVVIPTRRPWRS